MVEGNPALKRSRNEIFIVLCERNFETVIQVLLYLSAQRFVDEIFQFGFFVLSTNYVTLCIMSCC